MTVRECYEIIGSFEEVSQRLPGEDFIARMAKKFLDDGSMDLLRDSVAKGDVKEAFRAAHTLKGVCGNLSFTKLGESSTILTDAMRDKESLSEVANLDELLAKVEEDYKLTVEAIGQLQ